MQKMEIKHDFTTSFYIKNNSLTIYQFSKLEKLKSKFMTFRNIF